jgi:hypothetical protein
VSVAIVAFALIGTIVMSTPSYVIEHEFEEPFPSPEEDPFVVPEEGPLGVPRDDQSRA